jgi:hypothetical protein
MEQAPRRSFKGRLLKEAFVIIFFIALTALLFRTVLSGATTFVLPLDASDLIYPDYFFIAQSLKDGIFPLWDPHIFSGMSLAAYPQYGLFYPLNIIFWLFSYGASVFPYQAYEYIVIFHIFLAGLFMYVLGRGLHFHRAISIFMGVIYMMSPNILLFIVWANQVTALAWFPLLFLFLYKALKTETWYFQWLCGLVLGIIILASPAQPAIQALMLIGAFMLFMLLSRGTRKISIIAKTANIVFIGLAIGSISLLPVLEATPHYVRFLGDQGVAIGNEPLSLEAATAHKIEPSGLLGLLLPASSNSAVGRTFFGVVPLLLAVVGLFTSFRKERVVRFWTIISGIALVYALGIGLPYLFHYLPIINKIREPQRYLFFIALAIPILAAFGLKKLLFRNDSSPDKHVSH